MPVKFDYILPIEIVIPAFVVFLLVAFLTYMRRINLRASRFIMLFLRSLTLGMIFMLMLSPYLIAETKIEERPEFSVLIDNSTSMQLEDRKKAVASILPKLEKLRARYIVQFLEFGAEVVPYNEKNRSQPITAIGNALSQIHRGDILLLSDGQNNSGIDPLSAVNKTRSRIHTIAIGSDKEIKDQRIEAVNAPTQALVGSSVPVIAHLWFSGFGNTSSRVIISVDDKPVDEREIKVSSNIQQERIQFSFDAREKGLKKVSVKLEAKDDELNKSNNTYSTFIEVSDVDIRVYFLQGRLRYEDTHLIRQIAKLKSCSIHTGSISNELNDFDPSKYNVLVISDIPQDKLECLEKLENILTTNEVGVVIVPSPESIGKKSYLHDASPVHLNILRYDEGRYKPVIPKWGADILEKAEDDLGLVVMHKYLKGRVIFVATDVTWKWNFDADSKSKYKRFWHQILMWASRTLESLDVTLEKFTYLPGEVVRIVSRQEAIITVTYPGGRKTEPFSSVLGFTPKSPGDYQLTARVGDREKQLAFIVREADVETEDLTVNKYLLQELSKRTQGRSFDGQAMDENLSWLFHQARPEYRKKFEKFSFSENALFVLLFVFLLSIEWMIRRAKGLV